MRLHESPFSEIHFEEEKNLLILRWKNNPQMTDADYRTENTQSIEFVVKLKPIFFLANSYESEFAIVPETQLWAAALIQQYLKEDSFLKKVAVIPSQEFISRLSAEQNVEEIVDKRKATNSNTKVQFFENEEDAIDWLMRNES